MLNSFFKTKNGIFERKLFLKDLKIFENYGTAQLKEYNFVHIEDNKYSLLLKFHRQKNSYISFIGAIGSATSQGQGQLYFSTKNAFGSCSEVNFNAQIGSTNKFVEADAVVPYFRSPSLFITSDNLYFKTDNSKHIGLSSGIGKFIGNLRLSVLFYRKLNENLSAMKAVAIYNSTKYDFFSEALISKHMHWSRSGIEFRDMFLESGIYAFISGNNSTVYYNSRLCYSAISNAAHIGFLIKNDIGNLPVFPLLDIGFWGKKSIIVAGLGIKAGIFKFYVGKNIAEEQFKNNWKVSIQLNKSNNIRFDHPFNLL